MDLGIRFTLYIMNSKSPCFADVSCGVWKTVMGWDSVRLTHSSKGRAKSDSWALIKGASCHKTTNGGSDMMYSVLLLKLATEGVKGSTDVLERYHLSNLIAASNHCAQCLRCLDVMVGCAQSKNEKT